MVTEGLDRTIISKLTSQQVEQVTCTECCKYFRAPETAPCGHTLCHVCWKGRHKCCVCSAPLNKKALRANLPLQERTDNIHTLATAFEKLFNVQLEEFTLEILDELQSEDPTKHVKEWLASSENQFSAPVLSSQASEHNIETMELSKSNVQVHTHNKKVESPVKVVHRPQPQEDWDKIEVLPDTEEIAPKPKTKDLGVGPMDIEPFFVDDYEYTTENPRRSSRKKDKDDFNPQTSRDASGEKMSLKNSSETKSMRSKQNWSSVKKMRKEFGKLNKKNKSKLNVSIEMCKKAQAANKKKAATPPQTDSEKNLIQIDDNTPVVDVDKGNKSPIKHAPLTDDSKIIQIENNTQPMDIDHVKSPTKSPNKENDARSLSIDKQSSNDIDKQNKMEEKRADGKKSDVESRHLAQSSNSSLVKKSTNDKPMTYLKKSALSRNNNATVDNVKITQNDVESNKVSTNDDDIEISIRIGNKVTNIFIRNKTNDVQMKVNTDKGNQTSLGPYKLVDCQDLGNSPIHVQNIELNLQDNKVSVNSNTNSTSVDTHGLVKHNDAANSPIKELNIQSGEPKLSANKSLSTKKHTATADTVTATGQFEITDSMERELSDVMECLERKRKKTQNTQKSQLAKVIENSNKSRISEAPAIEQPEKKLANENDADIPEDMADLQDEDIFNSGSVKEAQNNVKLLKDAKYCASEILMPSTKSKKSQRVVDKRNRDTNDVELPSCKRQRMDLDKISEDNYEIQPTKTQEKDLEEIVSDSANYDVIMTQVFANIDADIQNSNKNIGKPTQTLKQRSNEDSQHNETQASQIIHKTLSVPSRKDVTIAEVVDIQNSSKEIINQKYSENVFSMLEKDSQPVEKTLEKNSEKLPPVTTQQHIDNLLTPGMCRDLAATDTNVTASPNDREDEIAIIEPIQNTPNVDNYDSDKSVVEETPQKTVSFTKPKQTEVVKTLSNTRKQLSRKTNKEPDARELEKASDSQIIKSIINISDTTMKDLTVVDNAQKKLTLETPLTINNFVHHIKHNSTPVARKSLNFDTENDDEQTLCPTTTQEKEFMSEAFKSTQASPVKKPLGLRNVLLNRKNQKLVVAGSCLSSQEVKNLKALCQERGWTYLDKYSKELTHLVVGVDEENKSQRSVKYMCALAASKWIVSYEWVQKCLQLKTVVDELPYEALDACGEAGPRRARTALRRLFEGVTFYCMPPFSVLDLDTLKSMLESAGGRVVEDPQSVKVTAETGSRVLLLLAEPEHTQEDRFVYLAMEHGVVPVNYEWALNCLGTYTLGSILDLLLCPSTLLPPATANWPAVLLMHEDDFE